MRPTSEIRLTLAAALVDGGGTTRQLAQRTGWSSGMTRRALDNMVTAGDAAKLSSVRVAGCKRPVPVYTRAQRPVATPGGGRSQGADLCAPGLDLISAWMRTATAGAARTGRHGAAM